MTDTVVSYPDTEEFALDFSRAEITLNKRIFTAISNISHNQPIEEGVIRGTRAQVLKRTRGAQGLGEGSIEWSDMEECQAFIDELGDGYSEVLWASTIVYVRKNKPAIVHKLMSCRALDVEVDHSEGYDGLPMTTPFTFMLRTLNGKRALKE